MGVVDPIGLFAFSGVYCLTSVRKAGISGIRDDPLILVLYMSGAYLYVTSFGMFLSAPSNMKRLYTGTVWRQDDSYI